MVLMQNYRRGLQQSDPSPFYNPEQARQKSFADFLNASNEAISQDYNAQVLPKYDYGQQAAQLGADTTSLNISNAMDAVKNASQNVPTGGGDSNPRLKAILRALGAQESGNNWNSVNRDSGALGRWQVMPGNIEGAGGWDMEALGRNVTAQQFLNNRRLQRKIVRNKFGDYLDQYGLKGALSSWYSGSPTKWNEKTPQGNYPSVHDYVLSVLQRLGL